MDFESWLTDLVDTPIGNLKRKKCLVRFTSALWKFVASKGYAWKITEKHLRNCIATGLYENMNHSHIASEWNYSDVNTDFTDDDLNHYLHIMDSDSWDQFWARYGEFEDVSDNSFRGQDRRQDIEAFVWKQIDIQSSPQTEELNEALLAGEEELPTGTRDVYLQEAEYNGWGGIRR